MKVLFESFTPVTAISAESYQQYSTQVPAAVVQAWRDHGAGFIDDGYFRFVDPVRAQGMLGDDNPLPADAVILFATAMGDLIGWRNGMFLVAKSRLGEIHATDIPFAQLVALMADVAQHREEIWDWSPYREARNRLGTPGFEECLMHVPMLSLGGRGDANQMQVGSLWIHLAMMSKLAGKPRFTHMLSTPQ